MPEFLRSKDGTPESGSGDILSAAADRVFRGIGFGAGDGVASSGFAGAAEFSADRTGGGDAGILDDLADVAAAGIAAKNRQLVLVKPSSRDWSKPEDA